MTLAKLVAVLIEIAGPDCHAPCKIRAAESAKLILAEAKGLPYDLLGAVRFEEGSYFENRVGKAGEVGGMQIKRDGRASHYCVDLMNEIEEPLVNVRCAVRLLKKGLAKCSSWPGALTWYNGGGCSESRYSKTVLETMMRARRPEITGRKQEATSRKQEKSLEASGLQLEASLGGAR